MEAVGQIKVVGHVKVTVSRADGSVETVLEKHNLVMREGKTILAKLLGHDSGYLTAYIDRITFGTSAAAAADTQTNLQCISGERITPAAAVVITYPAYNSVKFAAALEGNEGGSLTFQEMGLFSVDDKMFSRIVIPAIVKSSAYRIAAEWTISFQ